MPDASLYGIKNSNRDFNNANYWGKNQFNSSFPVALACYMRDQGIESNYLKLNDNKVVETSTLSFDIIFNTDIPNEDLFFAFEARYEPFADLLYDDLKPIDLVVKTLNGDFLRPIEIKLTTLPDITTLNKNEDKYGTELVIRSPTMRYMALSMAESCKDHFSTIKKIFSSTCHSIRNWENQHEINAHKKDILEALETFISEYYSFQKPLLLQPVWKTIGKSAKLADNCLDTFMWSDFAMTRLFMDSAIISTNERITRQQRAALRLARFLYEVSKDGKVYQQTIYDGMTYNTLNDKEFSISGASTHKYMKCQRLTKPIVTKKAIKNIILGGGQEHLSPERRFDAILFFSTDLFTD